MTYIYGLTDPNDEQIHYIGKSDNPKERLVGHLCDQALTPKTVWLSELKSEGLRPGLEILSEVDEVNWRGEENRWIAEGFEKGWPLTNAYGRSFSLNSKPEKAQFDGIFTFLPVSLHDSFRALPYDDQADIAFSAASVGMRYLKRRKTHQDWSTGRQYLEGWLELVDIQEAASYLTVLASHGSRRQIEQGLSLVQQNRPVPRHFIFLNKVA